MPRRNIENFSELLQYEIDAQAVQQLAFGFCVRHHVVVLGRYHRNPQTPVKVGMLKPDDLELIHWIEGFLARKIQAIQLNRFEIHRALEMVYGEFPGDAEILDLNEPRLDNEKANAIELVSQILKDALKLGASDIHIETYLDDVDVRYRIDGILHQAFTHVHPDNVEEVIRRIKILATLDLIEKRSPQDGRFRVAVVNTEQQVRHVDFRVSIIPGPEGADAVLRVLDAESNLMPLKQLGMSEQVLEKYERMLANPEGLIIVTGPTGSGKTTTLYASLNHLNNGQRKIVTAEDPVEYYVRKLNQKQVSPQMPLQTLLRALLRHDPDVMLFGEIRDHETGEVTLEASTTGHLVLGTLHTADALGCIGRLVGLGLDGSEIAEALMGIVAQRLVRKVCPDCTEKTAFSTKELGHFSALTNETHYSKGQGCANCHHTGYRGRLGLYELIVIDPRLQEMIARGAYRSEMVKHLRQQGFVTLLKDGLNKVAQGLTTPEELLRVIPYRQLLHMRDEFLNAQKFSHEIE